MLELIQFFDEHAHDWDSHTRESDLTHANEALRRLRLSARDRVLDVGCGTGILAPLLMRQGCTDFVGIDISPRMAEVYRSKFSGHDIIVGNFEEQPFAPESFSLVILFNAFPHFRQPAQVFQNAFRSLRSGGRFAIVHSMTRNALDLHHKKVGGVVGNDVLLSDDEIRRLFRTSGFTGTILEESTYYFAAGFKP